VLNVLPDNAAVTVREVAEDYEPEVLVPQFTKSRG
jgi:hypothetical protein